MIRTPTPTAQPWTAPTVTETFQLICARRGIHNPDTLTDRDWRALYTEATDTAARLSRLAAHKLTQAIDNAFLRE